MTTTTQNNILNQMITNLTPHEVVFIGENVFTFPASGQVARVNQEIGSLEGFADLFSDKKTREALKSLKFQNCEFGEVVGLPEPQSGKLFIVSSIVKTACPERGDLIVPSDFQRDEKGVIIGCKAFTV